MRIKHYLVKPVSQISDKEQVKTTDNNQYKIKQKEIPGNNSIFLP